MPYAEVNDLRMFYETHGTGDPAVVIPGGLMTSAMMGPLVSALAASRHVISIEPQAHGHTEMSSVRSATSRWRTTPPP